MREAAKLILALTAGVAVGGAAIPGLRAQTAGHPAYVVAEVHVTDPAGFMQYAGKVPATLAPYHGKTIARGLPDTREGAPPDGQVVVIAFDSLQDANHWYGSPEYQKIIGLRQKSAIARVYIVDGLAQ